MDCRLICCFFAVLVTLVHGASVPNTGAKFSKADVMTKDGHQVKATVETDPRSDVDLMEITSDGKTERIFVDRNLGIQVVLPVGENVCYYGKLTETDKSEAALEGNIAELSSTMEDAEEEKGNTTTETSCAYDLEDLDDEKIASQLSNGLCAGRKIKVMKQNECKDITDEDKDPHSELRKRRSCRLYRIRYCIYNKVWYFWSYRWYRTCFYWYQYLC